MATTYELEFERQEKRNDVPAGHLPVHRWFLQLDHPEALDAPKPPRDDLRIMRAVNPSVDFYRFLYARAGENWLWGDRLTWSDEKIIQATQKETIHILVLYVGGVPAAFSEIGFDDPTSSHIHYFAVLPGFLSGGLGSYFLSYNIHYAGAMKTAPLTLDTCSLDHPIALENYRNRGFKVIREEDLVYRDPRLEGTIPTHAAPHIPLAKTMA